MSEYYLKRKICVLQKEEIDDIEIDISFKLQLKSILTEQYFHYTKAELQAKGVAGEILFEEGSVVRKCDRVIVFFLDRQTLFIIENDKNKGFIKSFIKGVSGEREDLNPAAVFIMLIDYMVKNDMTHLQQIESAYNSIEEQMINNTIERDKEVKDPTKQVIGFRKLLLSKNFRYQQLADLCMSMAENPFDFFSEHEETRFRSLDSKIDRLSQQTKMLREYFTQLREIYLQNLEVKQNKIMNILTMVTIIFFPLTLIAGWYGMNFKAMPELDWQYGYPIIIAISMVIIVIEIVFFKRKKLW